MEEEIIIDLTNSFTLVDHCELENTIIDLVADDSIILSTDTAASESTVKNTKKVSSSVSQNDKTPKEDSFKFGDCPICWDKLGVNSLASTKCGHVFCLKCLEKALKVEKKCPTCRCNLNKKSAYHPLYLHAL